MITDSTHAQQVQTRRRESGKKGRSKAVRRWAKRECGTAIEAYAYFMPSAMYAGLQGDFTGIGKNFCSGQCMTPFAPSLKVCPQCGAPAI